MEINFETLNTVAQWILKLNVISLAAVFISFLAYRKSVASNNLSAEANKIAEEANQLLKINMMYNKEKDKESLINEITNRVIENWSKNGGVIANLLTEWNIYNKKLTEMDFENIWNLAYHRIKKRAPDRTFLNLLNEHTQKNK